MRKLKTTSEPLETTESALEMQQTGNTIILNPALHSAAGNLSGSSSVATASVGGGASSQPQGSTSSSRLARSRTSKKPPALVLTKESYAIGPGPGSGNSPGWKVTFPDIEIHSPKEDNQADNASISSRGTSSTVGYSVSDAGVAPSKWDSFGEADEGGVLSLQERLQSTATTPTTTSCTTTQRPQSAASSSGFERPPSASTLVATPSSGSNSSVVMTTTREYSSHQARRRNYIIFEQKDEDTLI